jgi:hypothetical protein
MYVHLRLNDVVATFISSETRHVASAQMSATELVLICAFTSSETSGVVHTIFLFFPLDVREATDECDANEATNPSSSVLARARNATTGRYHQIPWPVRGTRFPTCP